MPTTTTTTDAVTMPALSFALLYVSDLDTASAYFSGTLGFAHVPEQDLPGFRMYAPVGSGIAFGIAASRPGSPAPGTIELSFYTTELETVRTRWSAKGVETGNITHMPFGDEFTIPAPDGTLLTILQPKF